MKSSVFSPTARIRTVLVLSAGLAIVSAQAIPPPVPAEYFEQRADDSAGRKWQTGPQEIPPLAQIVARPGQPTPVYGIYAWGSEFQRASKEIIGIGFKSARLSGPMGEAGEALQTCAQHGIEVLYTLSNAVRRENSKVWKRTNFESDEAFIEDYLGAVTDFLKQFGPGGSAFEGTGLKSPVAVVEVMNEPNFQYMIPDREPRKEVLAERIALYGKVLEQAAPLIRKLAPEVKIAAFSCGGGGAVVADIPFVEGVTAAHPKIHDLYDIFTTHPYMDGSPPEAFKIKKWGPRAMSQNLAQLRSILATHGHPDRSIWFTELGFPLSPEAGGTLTMPAKLAESQLPADIQAAYIVRQYLWAMRLGVDRVHLMSLHDTDNYNSGILDRATLAWRPSAFAIHNLILRLPNPRLLGAIADGEGDTYAYQYKADHTRPDSPVIFVAWNVVGPAEVTIPWSQPAAQLFDMVGNKRELKAEGGSLKVPVGPFPVYIAP